MKAVQISIVNRLGKFNVLVSRKNKAHKTAIIEVDVIKVPSLILKIENIIRFSKRTPIPIVICKRMVFLFSLAHKKNSAIPKVGAAGIAIKGNANILLNSGSSL